MQTSKRAAQFVICITLLGAAAAAGATNGNGDGDYEKVIYNVAGKTGLPDAFVKAKGNKFSIGGCNDFTFAGFNVWQALELSANLEVNRGNPRPGREHLTNIMNKAVKMKLKVMRLWAHTIRNEEGQSLQPKKGQYNEEIFRGMDWINVEAGKRGLKIVWIFADNWYDIGGVKQYEKWTGQEFWSGAAKAAYKANINKILNRKNTINGKIYKNDPAIMAWNLANELRCKDCPSSKMQGWIEEMCGYVKGIDGNHMVGIGHEGFYGPDSGMTGFNPAPWAQNEGQNFIENHKAWCVDYAGIHVWPDNWDFVEVDFQKSFIRNATKNADKIGKPMILEEYGKIGKGEERNKYYRSASEVVETSIKEGGRLRGVLFYHWYDDNIGPGKYGVWSSSDTFNEIKRNANAINSC